jgi:hypothetical protein
MSLMQLPSVTEDARRLFAMMGDGRALLVPTDSPLCPELIDNRTGETFPASIIAMEELLDIGVITAWPNRERLECICGWSEFGLPGERGTLYRCTQ